MADDPVNDVNLKVTAQDSAKASKGHELSPETAVFNAKTQQKIPHSNRAIEFSARNRPMAADVPLLADLASVSSATWPSGQERLVTGTIKSIDKVNGALTLE